MAGVSEPADEPNGGEHLGKLVYLRGPHGQRDRDTTWRGGLGRLPGTGDGGLLVTEPRRAAADNVWAEAQND